MIKRPKKGIISMLALAVIACVSGATISAKANERAASVTGSGVFKTAEKTQYKSLDFEEENEINGWKFDSATMTRSDEAVVEISSDYYHSGKKSGHFKKDSLLENSWLESSVKYAINPDKNISYEVSAWVKTANCDPTTLLTLNMRSHKKDGKTVVTEQGAYTVMNTTAEPTEWKQLKFHTIITNTEATEFYIAFSVASGRAEFWIDDIQVREYNERTDEQDDKGNYVYLYQPLELDFHAKDENGKPDWYVSGNGDLSQIIVGDEAFGKISVSSGAGYISRKIYELQTGYSYKFYGEYTATANGIIKIEAFDSRNKLVNTYKYDLDKDSVNFVVDLRDCVSATYAVVSVGFDKADEDELTLKNLKMFQTAVPTQVSGWSAQWVWYDPNPSQTSLNQSRYFRYTFNLADDVEYAPLQISCDDIYRIWVNGYDVVSILSEKLDKQYTTIHYNVVEHYMIAEFLHKGENVIAIEGTNGTSAAGLIFDCRATLKNGDTVILATKANDKSLLSTKYEDNAPQLETKSVTYAGEKDGVAHNYVYDTPEWAFPEFVTDSSWIECVYLGEPPCSPWGAIYYDFSLYSSNTVKIVSVTPPKDVKAGDTVKIAVTLIAEDKFESVVPLQVTIWLRNAINGITSTTLTLVDKNTDMTAWAVGEETEVVFELKIPKYLESGEYQVQLSDSYITLDNDFNDAKFVEFSVTGLDDANEKIVSKIEDYNGVPTLTINGKPYSPIMYTRPELSSSLPGCEETISESGLELYSTRLNSQLETFWLGKNVVDFTTFDASVYDLMSANGDAKILLCITMFAPPWWMNLPENRDELVIQNYRDRENNIDKGYSSPSQSMGVSFASTKFRNESAEILIKLINHVKQQSYYNKIFAFQICAGDTYEWMVFQSGTLEASVDYSKASENGFKTYLRNKYLTQANLRKAWHDDTVTFDTAKIPTSTEKDPNGMGGKIFYDPQKDQRLIDFNLYLSDAGADTLLFYAEIVKTLTDNEKILGAFNGYMWTQAGSDANGKVHSSFNRLLNSEYIDFFASPLAYSERYLGQVSTYMPMIDSILSHGKMYIAEIDHRTSIASSYSENQNYGGGQGISTGKTYTISETVLQFKRDIVQGLLSGVGMWFFDMRGNWLGDEQFYQVIYDMKKEYDYSFTFTEKSNLNEVAVIVGEETYAYSTFSGFNAIYHFNNYLYRVQRKSLNTMGAGYDTYSMGDLVDGKVPEHKVYIMLSPIEVTKEESAAIDKYIKNNGHTVVWVYACGYSDGVTLSTDNISALTGFNVKEITSSSVINVRINDNGNALTAGLNGIKYGNSTQGVNPLLYVDEDPNAIKLGSCIVDGIGKTGLAVKEMNGWTSIYSGAMNLPVGLLRNILKSAGVHVYSENNNDIILTNANYVALYSGFAERKTIKLDGYYAVYDVSKGEYYSMNTNVIEYDHTAYDTALFRLSTPDKYRVTVTINGKGNVSGGTTTELERGGTYSTDLTAEDGYKLDKVTVNGEDVEVKNGRLELKGITANAEIVVTYTKIAATSDDSDYVYQFTPVDDGGILPVKIFLVIFLCGVMAFTVYSKIKSVKEGGNER